MKKPILVIPGHLGKDSGAITENQEEKYINLQQSISVCIAAKACGSENIFLVVPNNEVEGKVINVINMNDNYFSINDRINLANRLDAIIIEVHNNAATKYANGSEVICYSKYDNNNNLTEGYNLGKNILLNLETLGFKNRGVKPIYNRRRKKLIGRKLPLLIKTKNTSIIVESGFMTNKKDLSKIDVDVDGWNEQIGLCILFGIVNTDL